MGFATLVQPLSGEGGRGAGRCGAGRAGGRGGGAEVSPWSPVASPLGRSRRRPADVPAPTTFRDRRGAPSHASAAGRGGERPPAGEDAAGCAIAWGPEGGDLPGHQNAPPATPPSGARGGAQPRLCYSSAGADSAGADGGARARSPARGCPAGRGRPPVARAAHLSPPPRNVPRWRPRRSCVPSPLNQFLLVSWPLCVSLRPHIDSLIHLGENARKRARPRFEHAKCPAKAGPAAGGGRPGGSVSSPSRQLKPLPRR